MIKVIETCPHCQQPFELGENGTIDGCDTCLGVTRDKKGRAIYREDKHRVYQSVSNPNQFTWVRPASR